MINRRAKSRDKIVEPSESARAVGLTYVSDAQPGIRRERNGKAFIYRLESGALVRNTDVIMRIRSLAIPPAWTDVWICRSPNGHLQATGRDARKRKQHRYHPRWREIRDATKYGRMIAFARALPRIRSRVQRDLRSKGMSKNKVLAAVVKLLEVSLVRVGNDEYARHNNSFGLTTMKDRHVSIRGSNLRFQFRGKSGVNHQVDIEDHRLAKVVKACQDLPGQDLFQYIDDHGARQDVKSGDVNDYLREISGADFSAKDFRTWAGTVLAAIALTEFERFDSKTEAKRNIVKAIESVAKKLGNTVAICRKCYVHPDILDAYLGGTLVQTLRQRAEQQLSGSLRHLSPQEAAVLALLQQKLAQSGEVWLGKEHAAAGSKRRQRFIGITPVRGPRRNKLILRSLNGRLK